MKLSTKLAMGLGALAFAFGASAAVAGTNGTEFAAAVTLMQDWLEGSLGIALSLAFFGIGLFMGLMRQSLMSAAVAIGCAFAVQLGPTIITSIVTGSAASPEMAAVVIDAAPQELPAVLVN